MRVFCPEHKRGFFTPRHSPIKCENRGHILGELDFEGEAKPEAELQWQYCCNCEHFCPIDLDQDSLERCPVCSRRSSMLYLCDRCYIITFESNTPLQTKNFTLTSEGAPEPSCPGCLQLTSDGLREHTCDGLGASFITALNSCPICLERLDIGPSFPCSVAHYLRRTKVANKVNVTFDYESELFVPVEDGEFVLISSGNQAGQPILLPRSARFATRRDFYEFYQDYYHCTKPDEGEVYVIQPAEVARSAGGWKLQAPGILEVLEDHPKKKATTDAPRREVDTPPHQEPKHVIAPIKEESPVTPCPSCGSLVETKYAFCWKCGNQLTTKNESSVTHREKHRAIIPLAEVAIDEEDELTMQHELRAVGTPIFSWAMAKEPEPISSSKGSVLKLLAVAMVGLALVSFGIFALTRSWSRIDSATAAQPATLNLQSDPTNASSQEVKADVANGSTAQRTSAVRPQDDELNKLRERRIAARVSDRSAILQAFARAEKQYPGDYRFPYERAKLAIKESEAYSHDEAFSALSVAAEMAINSGKAHEMLDDLKADKGGDFHKLSHGHHEWADLTKALKRKDTTLLEKKLEVSRR
jgi:hypothetical protein